MRRSMLRFRESIRSPLISLPYLQPCCNGGKAAAAGMVDKGTKSYYNAAHGAFRMGGRIPYDFPSLLRSTVSPFRGGAWRFPPRRPILASYFLACTPWCSPGRAGSFALKAARRMPFRPFTGRSKLPQATGIRPLSGFDPYDFPSLLRSTVSPFRGGALRFPPRRPPKKAKPLAQTADKVKSAVFFCEKSWKKES